MTLAQLIRSAARSAHATQKDTAKLVRELAEAIAAAVKRGETVKIPGFGTFYPRRRKSRRIAGPPNSGVAGEVITLPSTESIGFRPAKAQLRMGVRQ